MLKLFQRKTNWWLVLAGAVIAEVVGFASGLLAGNMSGDYVAFRSPPLSPPGWVFGLVWPILYAIMGGVAGYVYQLHVSRKHQQDKQISLILYGVQLLLNFLWSILFFRWQADVWAIVDVFALWAINIVIAVLYYRFDQKAAYWQIPYILWLTFASYLTVGVAMLR